MTDLRIDRFSFRAFIAGVPMPTLIIAGLWILVLVFGTIQGFSLSVLLEDTIRRYGMWGLLVLAMVPSIQSGTGPNFALPIGVVCGILAIVTAFELGFTGVGWLFAAGAMAIVFGSIFGYVYGHLMNAVKGSEMIIATYTGFSITWFFCILWMVLPYSDPRMSWMLGGGLRNTIELGSIGGAQILNNFLGFTRFGIYFPVGMLLLFAACCFLVWLFFRSKPGIAISAAGMNPMFARASGLNVNKGRIMANMISTVLAAVGIIVFSQSFGIVSLYDAPLWMAFTAVASILIGGATAQRARIIHVVIGTFIFQGLMTNGPPVLNSAFPDTDLSEPLRMVVQNGIILYALTKVKGGGG